MEVLPKIKRIPNLWAASRTAAVFKAQHGFGGLQGSHRPHWIIHASASTCWSCWSKTSPKSHFVQICNLFETICCSKITSLLKNHLSFCFQKMTSDWSSPGMRSSASMSMSKSDSVSTSGPFASGGVGALMARASGRWVLYRWFFWLRLLDRMQGDIKSPFLFWAELGLWFR